MRSLALTGLTVVLAAQTLGLRSAAPYRVTVRLVVRATPLDGPTSAVGFDGAQLGPGERHTFAFGASDSLCSRSIGARPVGTAARRRSVEVTLVSAETDAIRLDVAIDRDDDGETSREVRHLTLTEGSPHLLDVLEAKSSEEKTCRLANVALELNASIVETDALRAQMLAYDLWLIERDQRGREVTRHERRDGRQGEQVRFRFQSLSWPLADLMPSSTLPIALDALVYGSIRGRLRNDGQVEVSLTADRDVMWTWAGSSSTGSSGDGGQKSFTVRPGEPVRVDLPALSGASTASGIDGASARLDYAALFSEHRTSIVLTIVRE